MKVLITGAKGQLGKQITNILRNGQSEIGKLAAEYENVEIIGVDVDVLDITDINAVRSYLTDVKPEIIINCAAYTNVDACESNEDLAFKINALGPRNLAIISNEVNAKVVHVSTDYVFSGEGTVPFKEYDETIPVSVYGKTKLAGEKFVREIADKYYIIRTAWLYGYEGSNFVYTIIKAGKEKGYLTVVDDQRGNPTNAEDLAHHMLKVAVTEEYGTYHCTGTGECSWYDFASKIIEFSNIDCKVDPVTSNDYVRAAKRPSYSSLDNMMLRVTVGDEMRNWEDALEVFLNNKK
ncbi:dTDP-4-dehydrorhamnose reductase [Clostridium intestinale]|uniref:dTDP-4-dehydrorhamnose reductase n=1 Tax=Clostridium intestinale URNW TaxID=1294142 RepID=U2NTH0_9CLOT|nr:dTDP-4-dehydrorhamnose reductase [Clostridium intestinale]ERK32151.1 dTDP-4-dehydrorhamnose reductase [Clostridium intestinale URNW]